MTVPSDDMQVRHFSKAEVIRGYRGAAILISFVMLTSAAAGAVWTFGSWVTALIYPTLALANRRLVFRAIHFCHDPRRKAFDDDTKRQRLREASSFIATWLIEQGASRDEIFITRYFISEKALSGLLDISLTAGVHTENVPLPEPVLEVVWSILDPKDDPRWISAKGDSILILEHEVIDFEELSNHERMKAQQRVMALEASMGRHDD